MLQHIPLRLTLGYNGFMAKRNKKITPQRITICAGYVLFALMVISLVLFTVLPFGSLLSNPATKHVNIVILIVSFSIGSIFPILVSYLIGNSPILSKNKSERHFNGVLFGALAYWIMSVFVIPMANLSTGIASAPLIIRVGFVNGIPILGAIIVTTILAAMYVRDRNPKSTIIEYEPYQVTLIALVLVGIVWPIIGSAMMHNNANVYSFITPTLAILFGYISYVTLRKAKLKKLGKLTWVALSVTVAFAAMLIFRQLISNMSVALMRSPDNLIDIAYVGVATVLALVGWAAYWRLVVIGFTGKKSNRSLG